MNPIRCTPSGRAYLLLLCILFVQCSPASSARCLAPSGADPRDMYIIAGQSNAAGLTGVHDTANYFSPGTLYPRVHVYGIYGAPAAVVNKDRGEQYRTVDWSAMATWGPARPGYGSKDLNHYQTIKPGATTADLYDLFGPELGFAAFLEHRHPHDHYLLKLAIGGTTLADDWKPGSYLYNELLEMVADAYNSIRDEVNLRIAGVFWMQGESDALDYSHATAYHANLGAFIRSLRHAVAEMGCPSARYDFPFIIGQIEDNRVWTYRSVVVAAQQSVGADFRMVGIVDTDSLARVDAVHFGEAGQYALGSRLYSAFFGLR